MCLMVAGEQYPVAEWPGRGRDASESGRTLLGALSGQFPFRLLD